MPIPALGRLSCAASCGPERGLEPAIPMPKESKLSARSFETRLRKLLAGLGRDRGIGIAAPKKTLDQNTNICNLKRRIKFQCRRRQR